MVSKVFMAASNAWWSFETLDFNFNAVILSIVLLILLPCIFSMIDGQGSNYIAYLVYIFVTRCMN